MPKGIRPQGKRLYEDAVAGPEFDELKSRFSHLRRRFGWQHLVETTYYRERLIASGVTDETALYWGASRAYIEAHAHDMDLRERHAFFGIGEGASSASVQFTQADLRFLAEHFADANSPEAQEIAAKAKALLGPS